jgi:hypothetical protein
MSSDRADAGVGAAVALGVSAIHQIALITSLPFVHTARRYYRLNGLVAAVSAAILRWGWSLAAVQLSLDVASITLTGVARGGAALMVDEDGANSTNYTLRGAAGRGWTSTSERAVLAIKQLQGHSAERPFEYIGMGHGWLGYVIPMACWLRALSALELRERVVAAVGITTALAAAGAYPLFLVYTGGEGFSTVHGGGFNVYFTGNCCGRRWDGERFFALDWHAEKVSAWSTACHTSKEVELPFDLDQHVCRLAKSCACIVNIVIVTCHPNTTMLVRFSRAAAAAAPPSLLPPQPP